jgi:hypothetical protein
MILSTLKRPSLTWAGCAALLGFGLLLSPLGPVRAAAADKQETRKFIVVGGSGGLRIVLGAEESPEDKALRLLKQARKLLTEQKQARPPSNTEKIREARRRLDALARQVAQQRRALQQAEAQLRQAQARLAQLEGKGDKKGQDIVFPKKFLLRIQDGKIIAVPRKKAKPGQLPDLEARLDRLLREVEALRRDVEGSMRQRR